MAKQRPSGGGRSHGAVCIFRLTQCHIHGLLKNVSIQSGLSWARPRDNGIKASQSLHQEIFFSFIWGDEMKTSLKITIAAALVLLALSIGVQARAQAVNQSKEKEYCFIVPILPGKVGDMRAFWKDVSTN